MILAVSSLAVFLVLISLGIFFWFWWAAPRTLVPPHLTEEELRRLEVQDRIRQTNYQVLTALGLGATFLTTLFQFALSSQHWSNEFELKINQERLGQFVEALRQLEEGKSPVIKAAGVRTLFSLGISSPERYFSQTHQILETHLQHRATKEIMKETGECHDDFQKPYEQFNLAQDGSVIKGDREPAETDVQTAMAVLGDGNFAKRRRSAKYGSCPGWSPGSVSLRLEHLILDNLDLSGLDFSCAAMSQSRFRRVSFSGADLRGSDLRGARFADYDVPASPSSNGRIGNSLYRSEKDGGPSEWKRYRCWVSDFRNADLSGADLEGAALAGADLRGANLTDANLCRADVSRVNFAGVKGLTEEALADTCVGPSDDEGGIDQVAQPFGLEEVFGRKVTVRRCRGDKICGAGK